MKGLPQVSFFVSHCFVVSVVQQSHKEDMHGVSPIMATAQYSKNRIIYSFYTIRKVCWRETRAVTLQAQKCEHMVPT